MPPRPEQPSLPEQDEAPAAEAAAAPAHQGVLAYDATLRHLALRCAIDTARTTATSVPHRFYVERAAEFEAYLRDGLTNRPA